MTKSLISETDILVAERPAERKRRRFSPTQKYRILEETEKPGETISSVARRHNLSSSQLFNWRRLRDEGTLSSLGAEERVVDLQRKNGHLSYAAIAAFFIIDLFSKSTVIFQNWLRGNPKCDKKTEFALVLTHGFRGRATFINQNAT